MKSNSGEGIEAGNTSIRKEHIVVVDSQEDYLRFTSSNLQEQGYLVTRATTGEEALTLLTQRPPDLVLLETMLTDIDGFEVCRRVRESSSVPIIILTSQSTQKDKIRGLELGADDYITKPFSVEELLARVRAVLRRSGLSEIPLRQATFTMGDLRIDTLASRVTLRGQKITLSPTEYRLLCYLAAHPGTVLARDQLLEEVWGPTYRGRYEVLRVTLWRLRQRLEEDPSNPSYIITQPGLGYMFASSE